MSFTQIVSVSGGKDSTATYLRAIERGLPFAAVFADTGNEHEATYDFVRELPARTGGPAIRWVAADFSADFARRRAYIAERWVVEGISADTIERVLRLLQPTGSPFLDLCLLKGRFPSAKARFCTHELKVWPIFSQVNLPHLLAGVTVISWQGVRGQGSRHRASLPRLQRLDVLSEETRLRRLLPNGSELDAPALEASLGGLFAYRPLLDWSTREVFAMHDRHGLAPNPLYTQGMSRVGCMPCINCSKGELREIARRFPEHVERIAEWEAALALVSKRGSATFFAATNDPLFSRRDLPIDHRTHGIRNHIEWAKTSRGGQQYDLEAAIDFATPCDEWGHCQ